ncbi:MAG: hypothetical protein ABEI06_02345, partial [Halobacteriaceae archaeon]
SAVKPQPIVVQWSRQLYYGPIGTTITLGPKGQNVSAIKQFDNMSAARKYVRNHPNSQIGGLTNAPSEFIPALEHYRMVHASRASMPGIMMLRRGLFRSVPAYVKIFERVPGATVHGYGPPNTTVWAKVTMKSLTRNSTFVYKQRAKTGPDGEFTMTLPYSTTGYDRWGTKAGYTNVSVRAVGPYTFTTGNITKNLTTIKWIANKSISEAHVIGENTSTITVRLEKQIVDKPEGKSKNNSSQQLGDPNEWVAMKNQMSKSKTVFPDKINFDMNWTPEAAPTSRNILIP